MTAFAISVAVLSAALLGAGWILLRAHRLRRVAARMEAQPTVQIRTVVPPATVEVAVDVGTTFLQPSPVSDVPVAWCRYARQSKDRKGRWTVFDEGGVATGVHVWDATGDAWLDLEGAQVDVPEVVVADQGRARDVERRLVPGDRLYVLGPVSTQTILMPHPESGVKEPVQTLYFKGTSEEPLLVRLGGADDAHRIYLRAARFGRIAALTALGLSVAVSGYLAWVASL